MSNTGMVWLLEIKNLEETQRETDSWGKKFRPNEFEKM